MKEEEAIYILQRLEWACLRCRSMAMEENQVQDENEDSASAQILRALFPWLFGSRSVLIPLVKLNARIRKGELLTPGEFYNMMYITDQTALLKYYGIRENNETIRDFPEPSPKIFSDWKSMKREDENANSTESTKI